MTLLPTFGVSSPISMAAAVAVQSAPGQPGQMSEALQRFLRETDDLSLPEDERLTPDEPQADKVILDFGNLDITSTGISLQGDDRLTSFGAFSCACQGGRQQYLGPRVACSARTSNESRPWLLWSSGSESALLQLYFLLLSALSQQLLLWQQTQPQLSQGSQTLCPPGPLHFFQKTSSA